MPLIPAPTLKMAQPNYNDLYPKNTSLSYNHVPDVATQSDLDVTQSYSQGNSNSGASNLSCDSAGSQYDLRKQQSASAAKQYPVDAQSYQSYSRSSEDTQRAIRILQERDVVPLTSRSKASR